MANAKVQEYLKGLQTERANLIKAAQDAIKELNEVGEVLGFHYSLTLDKSSKAKTATSRTNEDKAEREKRIADLLAKHPEGLFASQIHEKLGATDDAAKVRINNDLQAMQRVSTLGNIPASDDRLEELRDANGKLPKGKRPNVWSLA
ncbi:hypothetical protein [Tabrizicola sp.]|uniref:hypothetical protein n=1 Tax=Tabrizicola sp. TaxID=2005166 RepID=UPI0035B081CD